MTNQEIKNQFLEYIEDGIDEGMIGLDYAEEVFEYEDEVAFNYFKMFFGEELAEEKFNEIFGFQK